MSPGATEQMHVLNLTLFVDVVVQKTDKEDSCQAKESVTLAGIVLSEARREFLQGRAVSI